MYWRGLEHACATKPYSTLQISLPVISSRKNSGTSIYRLLNLCKMSNKITDARIKELQQLKDLKDELSDKIQTQKDDMQKILDSMDDEAQEFASSSSKAAKAA
jgi:hypothetical protein